METGIWIVSIIQYCKCANFFNNLGKQSISVFSIILYHDKMNYEYIGAIYSVLGSVQLIDSFT